MGLCTGGFVPQLSACPHRTVLQLDRSCAHPFLFSYLGKGLLPQSFEMFWHVEAGGAGRAKPFLFCQAATGSPHRQAVTTCHPPHGGQRGTSRDAAGCCAPPDLTEQGSFPGTSVSPSYLGTKPQPLWLLTQLPQTRVLQTKLPSISAAPLLGTLSTKQPQQTPHPPCLRALQHCSLYP